MACCRAKCNPGSSKILWPRHSLSGPISTTLLSSSELDTKQSRPIFLCEAVRETVVVPRQRNSSSSCMHKCDNGKSYTCAHHHRSALLCSSIGIAPAGGKRAVVVGTETAVVIVHVGACDNGGSYINPIMGRGAFLHAHLGISKAHSNTKLCMYVLCRLVFRRN